MALLALLIAHCANTIIFSGNTELEVSVLAYWGGPCFCPHSLLLNTGNYIVM